MSKDKESLSQIV